MLLKGRGNTLKQNLRVSPLIQNAKVTIMKRLKQEIGDAFPLTLLQITCEFCFKVDIILAFKPLPLLP